MLIKDRPIITWAAMMRDARRYSTEELRLHALVTGRNPNHVCQGCFWCACGRVLKEREHAQVSPQEPV